MAKKRKLSGGGKKKGLTGFQEAAIVVGGGLILWYLTRPGGSEPTPPVIPNYQPPNYQPPNFIINPPGQPNPYNPNPSIIERFVETITKGTADVVTGVAQVPGQLAVGTAANVVTGSEERTSQEVFAGQTRYAVPAFMANAPPGSTFATPVTYTQFMEAQPVAFRTAAGVGNVIGFQYPAKLGAYGAAQAQQGLAMYTGEQPGQTATRFAQLPLLNQAAVAVGQSVSSLFIPGGAITQGARFRSWLNGII